MSLWLRRRDLRTLLYIAIVIKFLATFEYIFIIFLLIFLLDFIVVTINLIQLLAAILIRINYLSIYLIYLTMKPPLCTSAPSSEHSSSEIRSDRNRRRHHPRHRDRFPPQGKHCISSY